MKFKHLIFILLLSFVLLKCKPEESKPAPPQDPYPPGWLPGGMLIAVTLWAFARWPNGHILVTHRHDEGDPSWSVPYDPVIYCLLDHGVYTCPYCEATITEKEVLSQLPEVFRGT